MTKALNDWIDEGLEIFELDRLPAPFWSVDHLQPSGDDATDFGIGFARGRHALMIDRVRHEHGLRPFIGESLIRIAAFGRASPLEAGFIEAIARAARAGVMN